jgi:hypothetical protein
MSRSPWRDALDGQIKVLRELRTVTANVHLARNLDVPAVREYYRDQTERAQFQIRAGNILADAISTLILEAEPIYLGADIIKHVDRQVAGYIRRDEHWWERANIEALTQDMLPIPAGLLWFPTPLIIFDPRFPDSTISVKALYFGQEVTLTAAPSLATRTMTVEATTNEQHEQPPAMGVIAFLDARYSRFVNMVEEFGDHLVPVLLGGWVYGKTLQECMMEQRELARADKVDAAGTEIIMAHLSLWLYLVFKLMLQRETRWGRVGLTRDEQREALRAKVKPGVQLVTWRKAEYQYPDGHIPVPIQWSHRWQVREHYRRYRSGKVVKVRSYVKGPADLPMQAPADRVHQIVR